MYAMGWCRRSWLRLCRDWLGPDAGTSAVGWHRGAHWLLAKSSVNTSCFELFPSAGKRARCSWGCPESRRMGRQTCQSQRVSGTALELGGRPSSGGPACPACPTAMSCHPASVQPVSEPSAPHLGGQQHDRHVRRDRWPARVQLGCRHPAVALHISRVLRRIHLPPRGQKMEEAIPRQRPPLPSQAL